jgi:16S rRNA (cytidine1402-2'-O)-methyltransferase
MEPALYVVATPLGNLRDITLRALDVLGSVDAVAAEDTRLTRQLLSHYEIRSQLIPLHEHNEQQAAAGIVGMLAEGKAVAYVTDAGTPAVSDPGALLVAHVLEAGQRVVPVPGPSAVTAALSAAGMQGTQFLFAGFLPSKSGARREVLSRLAPLPCVLVFYESPHRVLETLEDMERILGAQRPVVIAREITKMFESFHRCTLAQAAAWLSEDPNRTKGEFVLIVKGAEPHADSGQQEQQRVLEILLRELPLKQAVQLAAELTGGKRNALYARALELKGGKS